MRVIHVVKLDSPEIAPAVASLSPTLLEKINGLVLIPHHGVGSRVNLVPMPDHQLFKGNHVAPSRGLNQIGILCGGMIHCGH